MSEFHYLKKKAYEANIKLHKLGLVLFTFGNASAVDRNNKVFAIKPSGVAYEDLQIEDMVVVHFDGKIIEGELRPSSDTKTHGVLYKHWANIGGVVHTHSTYATAWAQGGNDIPILGTTHADHLAVDIPCTAVMSDDMIQGDYEHETGRQIIDAFGSKQLDPDKVPMVLVANHAPFAWGESVSKAVYHSRILEELAKMAWITRSINPEAPRLKDSLIQKHYERKHGKDSYYGQNK
jgi:L-ribulose-5-phosphate 4-epimerase